jgi:hypothetical protein
MKRLNNLINALDSITKKEMEQRRTIKRLLLDEKDLKKKLSLCDVVSTLFCDCEIPKPIDPFDVVDKHICGDCKEVISK